MSRVGKNPIKILPDVEVKIDGNKIDIKGPKGELSLNIHPKVNVERKGDILIVKVNNHEDKMEKSLWGTARKLIANMVEGVTNGFEKKLEVNGVGYKIAVSGNKLTLNIGFSHPVDFILPKGLSATVEKNVITLSGVDKQLVGEVAAQIRKIKKPEPYKGKGIKYLDEQIARKAGKAAKTATA